MDHFESETLDEDDFKLVDICESEEELEATDNPKNKATNESHENDCDSKDNVECLKQEESSLSETGKSEMMDTSDNTVKKSPKSAKTKVFKNTKEDSAKIQTEAEKSKIAKSGIAEITKTQKTEKVNSKKCKDLKEEMTVEKDDNIAEKMEVEEEEVIKEKKEETKASVEASSEQKKDELKRQKKNTEVEGIDELSSEKMEVEKIKSTEAKKVEAKQPDKVITLEPTLNQTSAKNSKIGLNESAGENKEKCNKDEEMNKSKKAEGTVTEKVNVDDSKGVKEKTVKLVRNTENKSLKENPDKKVTVGKSAKEEKLEKEPKEKSAGNSVEQQKPTVPTRKSSTEKGAEQKPVGIIIEKSNEQRSAENSVKQKNPDKLTKKPLAEDNLEENSVKNTKEQKSAGKPVEQNKPEKSAEKSIELKTPNKPKENIIKKEYVGDPKTVGNSNEQKCAAKSVVEKEPNKPAEKSAEERKTVPKPLETSKQQKCAEKTVDLKKQNEPAEKSPEKKKTVPKSVKTSKEQKCAEKSVVDVELNEPAEKSSGEKKTEPKPVQTSEEQKDAEKVMDKEEPSEPAEKSLEEKKTVPKSVETSKEQKCAEATVDEKKPNETAEKFSEEKKTVPKPLETPKEQKCAEKTVVEKKPNKPAEKTTEEEKTEPKPVETSKEQRCAQKTVVAKKPNKPIEKSLEKEKPEPKSVVEKKPNEPAGKSSEEKKTVPKPTEKSSEEEKPEPKTVVKKKPNEPAEKSSEEKTTVPKPLETSKEQKCAEKTVVEKKPNKPVEKSPEEKKIVLKQKCADKTVDLKKPNEPAEKSSEDIKTVPQSVETSKEQKCAEKSVVDEKSDEPAEKSSGEKKTESKPVQTSEEQKDAEKVMDKKKPSEPAEKSLEENKTVPKSVETSKEQECAEETVDEKKPNKTAEKFSEEKKTEPNPVETSDEQKDAEKVMDKKESNEPAGKYSEFKKTDPKHVGKPVKIAKELISDEKSIERKASDEHTEKSVEEKKIEEQKPAEKHVDISNEQKSAKKVNCEKVAAKGNKQTIANNTPKEENESVSDKKASNEEQMEVDLSGDIEVIEVISKNQREMKPVLGIACKKRKLSDSPGTSTNEKMRETKKIAHSKVEIDFTADVIDICSSPERSEKSSIKEEKEESDLNSQPEKKYEITDEEIMNNLDEIENIVLNSSTFIIDEENKDKKDEGEKKEDSNVVKYKNEWYEPKLQEKHELVKERLAKLARVLEYSYPSYKKWLNAVQTNIGTPVCRLKPPRRCSLKQPHTNRWKFTCNKKREQLPSEDEKQKRGRLVWTLEPAGAQDSDLNNPIEYPPFVMRAVKVFEDFLQTTSLDCEEGLTFTKEEVPKTVTNISDIAAVDEKPAPKLKLDWLWLLVRCNRKNELMFFVTAKNLNAEVMDRLKNVFETGVGKDCNVKSLYCKTIVRADNTNHSNTAFVMGSEALEEVVGGVKLQLGPKTNFWSNAAGAESLGHAICDNLSPTLKTTVVEIGCGIGLMGLMMASKCQKIIGLDSPAEVEEAEMICQMNNIKNASFVMGQPTEVMATIANVLSNCKASAIVNTNSYIGRGVDVMSSIRRISSLRRLVLVTTLTKQSVRSILELTRPALGNLGNPFIPIRACVVDTLPAGPHFEAVILMERRVMEKIIPSLDLRPKNQVPCPIAKIPAKVVSKENKTEAKPYPQKFEPVKSTPILKRVFTPPNKNTSAEEFKNKTATKRSHSPEILQEIPSKLNKKPNTFGSKPLETSAVKQKPWEKNRTSEDKSWDDPKTRRSFDDPPTNSKPLDDLSTKKTWDDPTTKQKTWENSPPKRKPWEEAPAKKKPWEDQHVKEKPWDEASQRHKPWEKPPQSKWVEDSPNLRFNPVHDKKSREPQDLRQRLSANRAESLRGDSFAQKVKEQHRLISKAKEKINAPSALLNEVTAKQLENMLDKVLEQTTKIHNQVSVWDRIAPPASETQADKSVLSDEGNTSDGYTFDDRSLDRKPRKFGAVSPTPGAKKYSNIPPLEPNLVMPVDFIAGGTSSGASKFNKKKYRGQYRQHLLEKMNKMKAELAQKRQHSNFSERSLSPFNRSMSPSHSSSKISPKKSLSPTKSVSPRRRDLYRRSPGRYSPKHSPRRSPLRVSPGRRPPIYSPERPPRHSPGRYYSSCGPSKRSISPKRAFSPIPRPISPIRRESKRLASPARRHSPVRRMSPYSRVSPRFMSPTSRGLSPRRMLSPIHHHSPPRHSPPRRVKTPPRVSPPARYIDDWDIPSRGAVEDNTWKRPEERWEEERKREMPSWNSPTRSVARELERERERELERERERERERMRERERERELERERYLKESKDWKLPGSYPEPLKAPEGWYQNETKAPTEYPQMNERGWTQGPAALITDSWNIRSKEVAKSSWMEKGRWEGKKEQVKDEWNDLPEDARDPWGDEAGADDSSKEILAKFNPPNWERELERSKMEGYMGHSLMPQMMPMARAAPSVIQHHTPQPVPHSSNLGHPMGPHPIPPLMSRPQWTQPVVPGESRMPWTPLNEIMKRMQGSSWPTPEQTVMNPYHNLNPGFQQQRPGFPNPNYPERR